MRKRVALYNAQDSQIWYEIRWNDPNKVFLEIPKEIASDRIEYLKNEMQRWETSLSPKVYKMFILQNYEEHLKVSDEDWR